jgi:hypothetical protein
MTRRLAPVALALAAVALAGCGNRHPVSGRVTYEDGAPVPASTVIAEATVNGKAVGVQGNIRPDGTYSWGGDVAGDGALPGEYKVLVAPRALGDAGLGEGKVPDVPGKYGKFESSGLKYTVVPGANTYDITVSRPKPKGQ